MRRIVPLKKAVRQVETILIHMALEECGRISKAAERLGVDKSTLSRKIQKMDM